MQGVRDYEATERIRELCIKEDWFTCGSTRQYEKMIDLVREGASVHDIALCIWLCSNDISYVKIELRIRKILNY